MEFLHLRNTHTEPSGGQPRTLTSGPKQNPGRAANPASGPLRNATSFFDGSEDVDHRDSHLAELRTQSLEQDELRRIEEQEKQLKKIQQQLEAEREAIRRRSSREQTSQPPRVGLGYGNSRVRYYRATNNYPEEVYSGDGEYRGSYSRMRETEPDNAGYFAPNTQDESDRHYGHEPRATSSTAIPAIQALYNYPYITVSGDSTVKHCQEKPNELEWKERGQDTSA